MLKEREERRKEKEKELVEVFTHFSSAQEGKEPYRDSHEEDCLQDAKMSFKPALVMPCSQTTLPLPVSLFLSSLISPL